MTSNQYDIQTLENNPVLGSSNTFKSQPLTSQSILLMFVSQMNIKHSIPDPQMFNQFLYDLFIFTFQLVSSSPEFLLCETFSTYICSVQG